MILSGGPSIGTPPLEKSAFRETLSVISQSNQFVCVHNCEEVVGQNWKKFPQTVSTELHAAPNFWTRPDPQTHDPREKLQNQ